MTETGSGRLVETPGGEQRGAADRPRRTSPEPARVHWYAWLVFAVAMFAATVVAISGADLPASRSGMGLPVGPVLLLGALIALSLNQLAFFPSQWSATAEAAVLVAAVVGFAGNEGAVMAPVVVAFLCGPLDLVHWRQRSYWSMAYNSGNRMIAALLGMIAFDAVHGSVGDPAIRPGLAALAVCLAFALVDLVLFVGFERLRGGQSLCAAVREDLIVDCLTVPLGLLGAVAGYISVEAGWWVGALLLIPASFVPELVLVRSRRALGRVSIPHVLRAAVPTILVSAIALGAVLVLAPLPVPSVLAGLFLVASVAGFELQVGTRATVSGSGLAAVVVAAIVVSGDAAPAGAVVVAVTTTATACVLVRRNGWWAPTLVAGAALASAAVFEAGPSRAGALVAAVVFELVLVTPVPLILWTLPLVSTAAALANACRDFGAPGMAVFGAGLVAIGAAAAVWGAPPWGSRVLGPWGARHPTRTHRTTVVTTAALSLGLAVAVTATGPSARGVLIDGASAAASAVATMAMLGVRQWRFAPRRRARDAVFLLVSALVAVLAYPAVALEGSAWSISILGVALAVCITIAWPLALRAEAAARSLDAPRRDGTFAR